MKLIIAGSHNLWISVPELDGIIKQHFPLKDITEVVCGDSKGVGLCGVMWAKSKNIPIVVFPGDWTIDKTTGSLRNERMASYGDAAIVIHCGTPGSLNMIRYMEIASKPCISIVKAMSMLPPPPSSDTKFKTNRLMVLANTALPTSHPDNKEAQQ